MKIHAVQTGSVRIKTAQAEGRGRALRQFARSRRVVYLPTHDPESAAPLAFARVYRRYLFEVMPMLERSIARWVRADAAVLLVITLWVVTTTSSSWMWFWVLFLTPDLSMIGYVFGPRVGAVTYNAGHLYAWPAGLLAAGVAYHASFATTAALSWIAHIAFDNVVGYGLKLPISFEQTVYGPIGTARTRISEHPQVDK